jgi:hypothetical protein
VLLMIVVLVAVVSGRLTRWRDVVRRFVHSPHCQRAVLAAILVNTLSMGIEYHNQV